ncbi:MAG TPA: 3'-5' exonuclease [archaeon]|nr:3'-5' exonuclease [archaeon]HLD80570.1 3'-5' exonuclease [archaeon]
MKNTYIAIDIEASGIVPGKHSILSIGACVPFTREEFYVELKPATREFDAQAMKVNGLSLVELEENGKTPRQAMLEFEAWIRKASKGSKPVFVAFPATFDWVFLSRYFYDYLGRNPFEGKLPSGKVDRRVLDLKSFCAGKYGLTLEKASTGKILQLLKAKTKHSHNALDDAKGYAECLEKLLEGTRRVVKSFKSYK